MDTIPTPGAPDAPGSLYTEQDMAAMTAIVRDITGQGTAPVVAQGLLAAGVRLPERPTSAQLTRSARLLDSVNPHETGAVDAHAARVTARWLRTQAARGD